MTLVSDASEASDGEAPVRDAAPPPAARRTVARAREGVDEGRRRRLLFFGVWGALLLGVLVVFRGVLRPFFFAVVVAYVLAPVVRWLEARPVRGRTAPRWVVVVAVYLVLLGAIVGFAAVGVPRLAAEVQKLARELPEAVTTVRDEWLPTLEARFRAAMREYSDPEGSPEPEPDAVAAAESHRRRSLRVVPAADGGWEVRLPEEGWVFEPRGQGYRLVEARPREQAQGDLGQALTEAIERWSDDTRATAATILQTAQTVIRTVVKGVFTFFIVLMISAYLLVTSERILLFFRSLWPRRRRRNFDRLVLRIDRGLSGVVRGQLVIALVNGLLTGVGLYVLEVRYWPVLTLIATLLSVIPIFGAILSTVPAVIIALQQGPWVALFVAAWIVVIHQIEANLLNPKIMGDAAQVHPVLVVFALLAGESLFGLTGALLAVPVLSITQSLFLHYREVMLGVPAPSRSRQRRAPRARRARS